MQADLEGMFQCFKDFQKNIDIDLTIKTCLTFKFSGKMIDKLEKEYAEKPDPEILQLCEMY